MTPEMGRETMRTFITRTVLTMLAVGVFASGALAASIPIGTLTWVGNGNGVPGHFEIVNKTGTSSVGPTFPAMTLVQFGPELALYADNGGVDSVDSERIIVRVEGNVHATDRVEVQATAEVQGDVYTRRIVVLEGGSVNGSIKMGTLPGPGSEE